MDLFQVKKSVVAEKWRSCNNDPPCHLRTLKQRDCDGRGNINLGENLGLTVCRNPADVALLMIPYSDAFLVLKVRCGLKDDLQKLHVTFVSHKWLHLSSWNYNAIYRLALRRNPWDIVSDSSYRTRSLQARQQATQWHYFRVFDPSVPLCFGTGNGGW